MIINKVILDIENELSKINNKKFIEIWDVLFQDENIHENELNNDLKEEMTEEILEELSNELKTEELIKVWTILFDDEITEEDIEYDEDLVYDYEEE